MSATEVPSTAADRRARRSRRLWAAVVAVVVATLPAFTPGKAAEVTMAAWTDAQAANATVGAGELPTPSITTCDTENTGPNGSFTAVDLAWTSPLADPAQQFLFLALTTGGPGTTIASDRFVRSGPTAGSYTYQVRVTASELQAAFGSTLVSTTIAVELHTKAGSHWVSPGMAERVLTVGTLAGGLGSATCDHVHNLTLTGLVASTPAVNRTIPVGTAATSSLPIGLQDRRRTPEYTATLRATVGGAVVPNAPVTITLPDGLAFESGAAAGLSQATFVTSGAGTVVFRVVASRSAAAQGPVRVASPRALTILSAQPVASVPLVAWGYNGEFQTGSDQSGNRLSAVPLWDHPEITGATALGSSYSTLLYADQDGALWGRGYNSGGIIGDGTSTNRPSAVPALTATGTQLGGIVQIARGTDQLASVAVDSSGAVWATGAAENGGFGPGYANTNRWQRISDNYTLPAGVTSAQFNGNGAVIMVLSDGHAAVAGADSYGYSAQGANVSAATGTRGLLMLTAAATPITGVVSAAIGWEMSAVVTSDGRLWTSGTASYGGGGASKFLVAKALPAGKSAARVVVGEYKVLVIMTDGSAYALGSNTSGALGTGTSANPGATLTPVALPAGVAVSDAATGNDASLFLGTDGAVYFSGANDTGVAGSGVTSGNVYTPTRVPLAHTALKIAATWYDTYFAQLG